MSQENDGFEEVVTKSTTWEPKQTGKKKDGSLKHLEASDKSYITGYFLETQEVVIQDKKSIVHKLQLMKRKDGSYMVGDVNHIIGDPSETKEVVTIWGSKALDGKIADNVQPGQAVRIIWKGKKMGKTGNSYHDWTIAMNPNIEPLKMDNISSSEDVSEFEDDADPFAPEPQTIAAPASGLDDFDDDEL